MRPRKLRFCERFVHLGEDLISFQDRPYLPAVYRCAKRNLVLRCSRQTEKSTFLANSIIYEQCGSDRWDRGGFFPGSRAARSRWWWKRGVRECQGDVVARGGDDALFARGGEDVVPVVLRGP